MNRFFTILFFLVISCTSPNGCASENMLLRFKTALNTSGVRCAHNASRAFVHNHAIKKPRASLPLLRSVVYSTVAVGVGSSVVYASSSKEQESNIDWRNEVLLLPDGTSIRHIFYDHDMAHFEEKSQASVTLAHRRVTPLELVSLVIQTQVDFFQGFARPCGEPQCKGKPSEKTVLPGDWECRSIVKLLLKERPDLLMQLEKAGAFEQDRFARRDGKYTDEEIRICTENYLARHNPKSDPASERRALEIALSRSDARMHTSVRSLLDVSLECFWVCNSRARAGGTKALEICKRLDLTAQAIVAVRSNGKLHNPVLQKHASIKDVISDVAQLVAMERRAEYCQKLDVATSLSEAPHKCDILYHDLSDEQQVAVVRRIANDFKDIARLWD